MAETSNTGTALKVDAAPKLAGTRRGGILLCGALLLHTFLFFLFLLADQFFWLNGRPYFVLGDDAMISMRYAWNWAHGRGIYWNATPTPEGYTNFLLVAVMSGLHKVADFAGISINLISGEVLAFNWLLALASIVLLYLLGKELTGNRTAAGVGALCLALSVQFLMWGKSGFETTMLVFFAVLAGLLAARGRCWTASLVLAAAVLTRDDAVLMVAAFSLTQLLGEKRGAIRRFFAITAAPFLAFVLHMVFRLKYYGAALPNTYYLKATMLPIGFRLSQGIPYTIGMLPAMAFAAWVLFRALRGNASDGRRRVLAALVAMLPLYVFYVVWVGGDAFSGSRLFASTWFIPCLAAGIFCAGAGSSARGIVTGVLAFALVIFSPWNHETAGAYLSQAHHLAFGVKDVTRPNFNDLQRPNENRMNALSCLTIRSDAASRGISHPSMAVYYAGAAPYFCPDFDAVDLLGKSDAVIAREAPHIPGRVGHDKYDYEYSFLHYHPTYLLSLMNNAQDADDPAYIHQKEGKFNWQHLATDEQFREHYYPSPLAGTRPVIYIRDGGK